MTGDYKPQDDKYISRLKSLNKAVDEYLVTKNLVAAIDACIEAMDKYRSEEQQTYVLEAANVLLRLVSTQDDQDGFSVIANRASGALSRHSLHSKALNQAKGRHYEYRLKMEEACGEYLCNLQLDWNDPVCWQDLIRALSARAITSDSKELDSYLDTLLRQDETSYPSVVISVLDAIEASRPEDFYILAARAHAIAPDDLALWQYWVDAMIFVGRDEPQDISLCTIDELIAKFKSMLPDLQYKQSLEPRNDRRIRVGYIGSKLHFMFLLNHIKHHDFNRFDIHIFTDDIRCSPGVFGPHVSINPLGPGDPTERLHQARLDIAIEMMGPSFRAYWRGIDGYSAFARRIAPVQCHWISTKSTYGTQESFDCLIADEGLVPKDLEHLYFEKVKRLPKVAHCWFPSQIGKISTKAPVLTNRYITFGSANRGTKITPETLNRWACIVAAVPDSRMIIKGAHINDPVFCARALDIFTNHGVQHCIDFSDSTPHPQFPGDFYSQIDISLDTFPYNGGITTLESLWNGVPVITLRGAGFVSRLSSDYLDLIGRSCWVADNEKTYIEIAVEARDSLQAELAYSPLADGHGFARDLESAFLDMLHER